MNINEITKAMLAAAAGEGKKAWGAARTYLEAEARQMTEDARTFKEEFVEDMRDSETITDATKRKAAIALAKRRLREGMEGIERTAADVFETGKADVKLAAQSAINAALGVLKAAVNTAIGVPIV